jgi:hypothetical protein
MKARGVLGRWIAGGAPLGFLWFFVAAGGCARSVTEDDCKEVGAHLRALWTAEAKFPETGGSSAEKAVAVIKSEGQALETSFIDDCKKDFVGKPRASGEFSCLSHAKTLADVKTCATIPAH